MKALISGFEPFGGDEVNPSQILVERHLPASVGEWTCRGVVLPVSFRSAFPRLKHEIDEFKPELVLAVGLAKKRHQVSLERIAINWMEAEIPDNEGDQPQGEWIKEGAPDGVFSSLPLGRIQKLSKERGLDLEVSNSAGTYVCNCLMFELLLYGRERGFQAGFVHIPPSPELRGFEMTGVSVDESWRVLKETLFLS